MKKNSYFSYLLFVHLTTVIRQTESILLNVGPPRKIFLDPRLWYVHKYIWKNVRFPLSISLFMYMYNVIVISIWYERFQRIGSRLSLTLSVYISTSAIFQPCNGSLSLSLSLSLSHRHTHSIHIHIFMNSLI